MRKQNNNFRRPPSIKERPCSCGGKSKLGSRRNYPFGKKAKPRRIVFFKCKSCGDMIILGGNEKGGR